MVGLAGCATTRQASKGIKESGFLGDYSQLQKGKKGQAALVYTNPSANWANVYEGSIDPCTTLEIGRSQLALGQNG
ncbi:MAG TPA: DUF3313 family protein [Verrucomicrobiae bacterium]|nr:DUF3313 family protein [Verrucomicrobiae bacterium]